MKLLPLLLTLFSFPLTAQILNFQPGYYVNLAGDSIRAEISLEGRSQLTRQVRLRTEKGGKIQTFSPGKIRGFGFPAEDAHYLAIDHTYVSDLGAEIINPRFALRLVDGPVKLYRIERQGDEFTGALADIEDHLYYLLPETGPLRKLDREEKRGTGVSFSVIE